MRNSIPGGEPTSIGENWPRRLWNERAKRVLLQAMIGVEPGECISTQQPVTQIPLLISIRGGQKLCKPNKER